MPITVVEVAGLIGVVLVVSTGKVFDPIREFLRLFKHPRNPSRWLADLISCSMCSGVWIGAIWGLAHSWSWGSIIVFAGLLSVLSFAANEVLGLIGILTLRVSSGMVARRAVEQQGVVQLAQARQQAKGRVAPRKVGPGNDLTEDEAEALLDQETERADALAEVPRGDEAA